MSENADRTLPAPTMSPSPPPNPPMSRVWLVVAEVVVIVMLLVALVGVGAWTVKKVLHRNDSQSQAQVKQPQPAQTVAYDGKLCSSGLTDLQAGQTGKNKKRWTLQVGFVVPRVVTASQVVLSCGDPRMVSDITRGEGLVSLNKETGQVQWAMGLRGRVARVELSASGGGTLVVLSEQTDSTHPQHVSFQLSAFSLATGSVRWTQDLGGNVGNMRAVGSLVMMSAWGRCLVYQVETGELLWDFGREDLPSSFPHPETQGLEADTDGRQVVVIAPVAQPAVPTPAMGLVRWDAATKRTTVVTPRPGLLSGEMVSRPVIVGGQLVVNAGIPNDKVTQSHRVSIALSDGSVKWETPLAADDLGVSPNCVDEKKGRLIFPGDKKVLAYDLATGKLAWSKDTLVKTAMNGVCGEGKVFYVSEGSAAESPKSGKKPWVFHAVTIDEGKIAAVPVTFPRSPTDGLMMAHGSGTTVVYTFDRTLIVLR